MLKVQRSVDNYTHLAKVLAIFTDQLVKHMKNLFSKTSLLPIRTMLFTINFYTVLKLINCILKKSNDIFNHVSFLRLQFNKVVVSMLFMHFHMCNIDTTTLLNCSLKNDTGWNIPLLFFKIQLRSEERRVGKEC